MGRTGNDVDHRRSHSGRDEDRDAPSASRRDGLDERLPRASRYDGDSRGGGADDDDGAYHSRRGRRRERRASASRSPSMEYRGAGRGRAGSDDDGAGVRSHGRRGRRDSPSRSRSASEDSFYERRRERRRRFRSQWDVKPDSAALAQAAPGSGGATGATLVASQATRHARRIYVGGLQPPIVREDLEKFFMVLVRERVKFVHSPLPTAARPVINVYINHERKFAFVEFATMELATVMLHVDGIEYQGLPLKIKRPNDYDPSSLPPESLERQELLVVEGLAIPAAMGGAKLVGGHGGGLKAKDRVFVSNLPPDVDEKGLGEIFGAFGKVLSIYLVRGEGGASRGFGFVELQDESMIDAVCSQLNGIEIVGRNITVTKAKAGTGSAPSMAMGGAVGAAGLGAAGANPLAALASGHIPAAAGAAMPIAGPPPGVKHVPGTVLCLEGVATPLQVASPPAMGSLVAGLATELSRFGAINLVVVPRAPQGGVGRVFLQFEHAAAASSAATVLAGRTFESRPVQASVYDTAAFAAGEYGRAAA